MSDQQTAADSSKQQTAGRAPASAFHKVVRVGTVPVYDDRRASLFAKIEYTTDGRLSISGVIGPMRNGDAVGGCGQISMEFKECDSRGHLTFADINPAPGWDTDTVRRFFETWNRWHLNDMHAGCEHQRELPEFQHKDVTITRYQVDWDARRKLQKDANAIERAFSGGIDTVDPEKRMTLYRAAQHDNPPAAILLALFDLGIRPFSFTSVDQTELQAARQDIPQFAEFEASAIKTQTESKSLGWLYQTENPDGFLGRPCPVCGYKYGTEWKREEVPTEVLEWLRALPNTDIEPAWV